MNISHKNTHTQGITLIEVMVYLALLVLLTTVVLTSLISLFKSYSIVHTQQNIETSAIQVFDKITRDIHSADNIVIASSSFNVPQGAVALTISSSTNPSSFDIYRYYVQDKVVYVSKNGATLGRLSLPDIRVENFLIRHINGTSTQALKIEMRLESSIRFASTTQIENFYTTVQLRN